MITYIRNKDFRKIEPVCKDGSIFIQCDFTKDEQAEICKGKKNLIFAGCKLEKCIIPQDAKIAIFGKNARGSLPDFMGNFDVAVNCNFSQEKAHTEVCANLNGLRIIGSNCMNCDFPTGTIIDDSLSFHKDILVEKPLTDIDHIQNSVETIKREYGETAVKEEVKKYFDLKDNI